MPIATAEGFGRGFVDTNYPMSETGVAALNGFYFGFGVGDASPDDNHIQYVMIAPGGTSTDLTPNADLSPNQVPAGRLQLGFRDKDHDSSQDRYFYRTSHAMLSQSNARRYQVRDLGATGSETRPLPPELLGSNPRLGRPLVAIAGFAVHFTGNRDHHLDRLAVMINDDNTYTVTFADKNNDDVYAYVIDFVRISGFLLDYTLHEAAGSAKGFDTVETGPDTRRSFVLRGFAFDFRNSDHHIREIGVLKVGSRLQIIYADKNGDDRFDYQVKWAQIGMRVLPPIATTEPHVIMADSPA